MSKKVKIDDLASSVNQIMETWSDEVVKDVNESIKEVAKESQQDLKVAGSFENRTGKYRKGWKIQFTESRLGLSATIYNKVYQLTHLLESGHAKVLWGRRTGETVKAFPHIEAVNEEAHRKLEEEIKRRIG